MDAKGFECLIFYYGRIKFFQAMQKTSLEAIANYPTSAIFKFYSAVSLVLNQNLQQARQELIFLKDNDELADGVMEALLYINNCQQLPSTNQQELSLNSIKKKTQHLENNKFKRETFSINSLYAAAVFLFLTADYSKSIHYINKILQVNERHECSLILKCWLQLGLDKRFNLSGGVLQTLEEICTGDRIISASLLLVHNYNLLSQFEKSMNLLNRLSIRYPEINMPLIVKMNTRLAALNYEQAYEIALRIINLEPTNIQALCVKAFILLVHEGDIKSGISCLQQLLVSTERMQEEGNIDLMLNMCQLFARISSRNSDLLNLTLRFIEKQIQHSNNNFELLTELANQKLMLGHSKEASICFRCILNNQKDHYKALSGIIFCQLLDRNAALETIRPQIEYLVQIEKEINVKRNSLTLFLRAKLLTNLDDALSLLIEAIELHMKNTENQIYGLEYIHSLNPDFLLQIITEMLLYCPVQLQQRKPRFTVETPMHISLKEAIHVLEIILKSCPSLVQAIFLRAKVYFLCDDIHLATIYLQRIINDLDSTYIPAYLLLSKILIQREQFSKALQMLELALSSNFAVRCNPNYNLMVGMAMRKLRKFQDAQKSFKTALSLLNVDILLSDQELSGIDKISSIDPDLNNFTIGEKVTLYLELIGTLKDIGDSKSLQESEHLLEFALQEFNNTSEEGRLLIAQAEFLLQSGKIQETIQLLSDVKPEQSFYIQTRTYLANIHLQYYKDQISFVKCFKKLVNTAPTSCSYRMLGEAFISIQEPDLAIAAYQQAFELNPNDLALIERFGKVYAKTHYYRKAVEFYKKVFLQKKNNNLILKLDFVEVYIKLNKLHSAEAILMEDDPSDQIADNIELENLKLKTKKLLTLARVYKKLANSTDMIKNLEMAMSNQLRIQKRILVDRNGSYLQESTKILSRITLELAQCFITEKNYKNALHCYKDCLEYSPDNVKILIALGRLYLKMDSLELCQEICLQILKIDNLNMSASIMMADFSFKKLDLENAGYYYSQILLTQPCYWVALARLIEVMQRSGMLDNIKPFLAHAIHEINTDNSIPSNGLYYCRGLFEWFSGNPNAALDFFNRTRKDQEWGQKALINMIKICINFESNLPLEYVGEMQDIDESEDAANVHLIALSIGKRLLKELQRWQSKDQPNNQTLTCKLLASFLKLATKQKSQIESALQEFTNLMTSGIREEAIGSILGIATALFQLKQLQQAKSYLKPLLRLPWKLEEAEYLEKSWLLLASIYVSQCKWETAQSLVDKVLSYNKSSVCGHVLGGIIAEKLQMHQNAAKCFQIAWKICGRSKSYVGYRLAYNYMKDRNFSEAMEICNQILAQHKDSTDICKNILDCCTNLRS